MEGKKFFFWSSTIVLVWKGSKGRTTYYISATRAMATDYNALTVALTVGQVSYIETFRPPVYPVNVTEVNSPDPARTWATLAIHSEKLAC